MASSPSSAFDVFLDDFLDMGYSEEHVRAALQATGGDPERALAILEEADTGGKAPPRSPPRTPERPAKQDGAPALSWLSQDSLAAVPTIRSPAVPSEADGLLINSLVAMGHVKAFAEAALLQHHRSLSHTLAQLASPCAPFLSSPSVDNDAFLHADADALNVLMGLNFDMNLAAQALKDHGNSKRHAIAQLSAAKLPGSKTDVERQRNVFRSGAQKKPKLSDDPMEIKRRKQNDLGWLRKNGANGEAEALENEPESESDEEDEKAVALPPQPQRQQSPPPPPQQQQRKQDKEEDPRISQLVLMGFDRSKAAAVLEKTKGNVEAALEALVQQAAPAAAAPPPPATAPSPTSVAAATKSLSLNPVTKEFKPSGSANASLVTRAQRGGFVPTQLSEADNAILMGFKSSMCGWFVNTGMCSFGAQCTFAHGHPELAMYRQRRLELARVREMDQQRIRMSMDMDNRAAIEAGVKSSVFVPGVGVVRSAAPSSLPAPAVPPARWAERSSSSSSGTPTPLPHAPGTAAPGMAATTPPPEPVEVPPENVLYVGNLPKMSEPDRIPSSLSRQMYAATGIQSLPITFRSKARHFVFVDYPNAECAALVLQAYREYPERFHLFSDSSEPEKFLLSIKSRVEGLNNTNSKKEQEAAEKAAQELEMERERREKARIAEQAGLAVLSTRGGSGKEEPEKGRPVERGGKPEKVKAEKKRKENKREQFDPRAVAAANQRIEEERAAQAQAAASFSGMDFPTLGGETKGRTAMPRLKRDDSKKSGGESSWETVVAGPKAAASPSASAPAAPPARLAPAPAKAAPLILIPGPGFVFHCNKDTRGEVLSKMLFGSPGEGQYKDLRPGAPCFLFNYSDQSFEGLFMALTPVTQNIDASAWRGKYPYQVRFKDWSTNRVNITRDVMASAVGKNTRQMRLPEEKQQALTTMLQRQFGLVLPIRVKM
jgi:hypothetical protein